MNKRNFLVIFTTLILLVCVICSSCTAKDVRIRNEYNKTEATEMKLAIWSFPNADKYRTDEE